MRRSGLTRLMGFRAGPGGPAAREEEKMSVIALLEFNEAVPVAVDTALGNGAQDGTNTDGAAGNSGRLQLDGINDKMKAGDESFQLGRGTLDIQFAVTGLTDDPQTVLSRDSVGQTAGGYRIEVLGDGSVAIAHETAGGGTTYTTGPGFIGAGDEVNVSYSWDEAEGGRLVIENQTAGTTFSAVTREGLTMDMGDINQTWMVGAGQSGSDPFMLNNLDKHMQGSVEYFQIADRVDNNDSMRDGIVEGADDSELIDGDHDGDPDGDFVDNDDAIIPGDGPDDDRIYAYGGDDMVRAGEGDDTVYGGGGHDDVDGGADNDMVDAGFDDDEVYGGRGNDTIRGGEGVDSLYGGADRDVFIVGGGEGSNDFIDGNEGGNDFDTLDLSDAGPLRITHDGNPENGTVTFLDDDGNETGTLTFRNIENVSPCFTPGTLIATPKGEVPVEGLRAGDQIITRDNGIQTIRWTGARHLDWAALSANPHLKPILIRQGSLGNGLPERDMLVSPNHRMLVASDRTALYFAEREVLVAAKHLTGAKGVQAIDSMGTTYIHFMFDRHEVVLANGAWSESFQPGDQTLKGMGNAQRSEIFELFPELKESAGIDSYAAARRTLKKHEASLLLAR
jgi:hypothetical protein